MPVVIQDRYRVVRELSHTLRLVLVCEDMRFGIDVPPTPASVSTVVIKQVSLERMTNFMQTHPSDGHILDNPIVEKGIGDLVRAAGGHPNLVKYIDSFVKKQTLYLVTEHCVDGDLHDYISRRGKRTMACTNVMNVLSQVAAGLAFLHENGIAHRDVSLENIMLHRGRCKLGDFGLATQARSAGGRPVGKQYYMAPEILAGETYDPKPTDVWALGIVVFILLTGSPLVSLACMSTKSFRSFQQAGVVPVLRSWGLAASLPASVLNLLSGMLETDPKKRLTITQVLEHDAVNSCHE